MADRKLFGRMAMYIRHKKTGEFVSENGWTTDRKQARDFLRLEYAVRYRLENPVREHLEIIYQSRDKTSTRLASPNQGTLQS